MTTVSMKKTFLKRWTQLGIGRLTSGEKKKIKRHMIKGTFYPFCRVISL